MMTRKYENFRTFEDFRAVWAGSDEEIQENIDYLVGRKFLKKGIIEREGKQISVFMMNWSDDGDL